jgi:hypothetical protein
MRHSLSDKSVRAATVLGSWQDIPGIVHREELAATMNDKHKRPKGKGGPTDSQVTLGDADEQEIVVLE